MTADDVTIERALLVDLVAIARRAARTEQDADLIATVRQITRTTTTRSTST